MQEQMAKQLVVKAGLKLVETGLIARTWGNVSCRVDKNTFVITPSGRPYETLQPEEIVLCKIEDCSYEGELKPSSEKRLHALIYQKDPQMNFVIHTHQRLASVVSATRNASMPVVGFERLGNKVPIAAYGLPGTKKLKQGVEAALKDNNGHAVIMAHHGALCYGRDEEEAFLTAKQLEEACQEFLKNTYLKTTQELEYVEENRYRYYVSSILGKETKFTLDPIPLYNSRRIPLGFVLEAPKEITYHYSDDMPPEALIHGLIYQEREDINFIAQDTNAGLVAVSLTDRPLRPLLDDFAQIVGINTRCAKAINPKSIVKALKGRMGVLVPQGGALCCAADQSDLQAVRMVMEKNTQAQIGAQLFGGGKALSSLDCRLMNFVYKKSYAKKAKE